MINSCTSSCSCVLPESSTCVTLFGPTNLGKCEQGSLNPGTPDRPGTGWKECGHCQMQGAPRRTEISHQRPGRSSGFLTLVIEPLPLHPVAWPLFRSSRIETAVSNAQIVRPSPAQRRFVELMGYPSSST